eukprot:1107804-Pleurochrysis_carterae.AAC.1
MVNRRRLAPSAGGEDRARRHGPPHHGLLERDRRVGKGDGGSSWDGYNPHRLVQDAFAWTAEGGAAAAVSSRGVCALAGGDAA